jgi:tetratricopeptide (TPR) repeat protein
VLLLDKNGNELDWIVGYRPPAESYLEKLQKALAGVDTYKALADRYAKDPKNIETIFKLAQKYDQRSSTSQKANDLYKQILALDPEGKAGLVDVDYPKVRVPYSEYAEFILARKASFGAKPDPGPMRAFIQKYQKSPLVKSGYSYMVIYYGNYAPKDEARAFFEEYTAKYPDDLNALSSYVRRIIRDKEPLDKGLQLADRIGELTSYNPDPYDVENRAELLWLKGDKEKAEEIFGKSHLGDRRTSFAYELASYADFWNDLDANLEQAAAAIELAILIQPETPYLRQTAATICAKAGQPEKALEVFGPEYLKKNLDKPDALYPYAWYWNKEEKNLESALEAIKRMIEIQPGLTYFDIQSQLLLKLKKYDEALASAEKALALARESAKRNPAFATKTYEARVQEIQAAIANAIAKEKK